MSQRCQQRKTEAIRAQAITNCDDVLAATAPCAKVRRNPQRHASLRSVFEKADIMVASMSDADNAFVQATDKLIALYRSIERSTLDLPLVSFMPLLIFFWSYLKFFFFFIVGLFLIIPTNLVILVRNLFPGHWRYRPFFLSHLYYVWLWLWRGEAPTAPAIFIRPLLNIFMTGHFDSRLRRLRAEILLRDGLSDATRSALLARLARA
jgi:hypothetical protein